MCGRYFIDMEAFRSLMRIYHQKKPLNLKTGDIYPHDDALLIVNEDGLKLKVMNWGLPLQKQLLINVRSETVMEKPFFKKMIHHQRCVIPACQFYEWTPDKQKVTFSLKNHPIIYMAGLYAHRDGVDHYMILTTAANESVKNVHHRMPVLLEEQDVVTYLSKGTDFIDVFKKDQPLLEATGYSVQLSFPI